MEHPLISLPRRQLLFDFGLSSFFKFFCRFPQNGGGILDFISVPWYTGLKSDRKGGAVSLSEHENILGTMPVGRLVIHMSWPIMLSMLVQAVYNLVDSIYVARINDTAFLALSYAYPIQTLMVAFCVGTGVGFNAVLARRLGEKKAGEANSAAIHGFLLYALCWLLFLSFGLLGSQAYLRSCTDTLTAAEQGAAYLQICCCFSFGMCAQFPLERVLQSTGHPAGFMIVQGSGAVLNLILDPILIFGFDMGVRGAAIATVAGQTVGALIGVYLVFRIREQFPLSLRGFRFQPALAAEMGRIAAPAILMQALGSLMSLGLNTILNLWSETAVWVLGVYFKLQTFVFMPVFSINNGMISILSYNCGARNRNRVSAAIRFGLRTALAIALLGGGILWLFASPLLELCFQAGAEALALGVPALRMSALAFPAAALTIIWSASFQSLGYSRYSLGLTLLRQVVLLLPLSLLLVRLAPDCTFLAFFLSETLALLAALVLFRKVKREKIDRI